MQMTWFCVVSRKKTRGQWWNVLLRCEGEVLKDNAGKSKVMVFGGEGELEYEVFVDGICLEHVSEFKYLGFVLNESGTDEAKFLQESLLVTVLMYGSETMIWKEKERCLIRAV